MTTTNIPSSSVLKLVASPVKYLVLSCALLVALLALLSYETDYTKVVHVESTVISKEMTPSIHGHGRGHSPRPVLAVRNPDGTQQDIYPTRAQYAGTAVGDKIAVVTSPQLRDEPQPGSQAARVLVLIVLSLAFAASVVTMLGALLFSVTSKQ